MFDFERAKNTSRGKRVAEPAGLKGAHKPSQAERRSNPGSARLGLA